MNMRRILRPTWALFLLWSGAASGDNGLTSIGLGYIGVAADYAVPEARMQSVAESDGTKAVRCPETRGSVRGGTLGQLRLPACPAL